MRPLGLMGGTFDPPHFGHLRLAEEALETLDLTEVRWIPSGKPGHRDAPQASPADRLAMVKLATVGQQRFTVDDYEIFSTSPTFTVNTLKRLRASLGDARPLAMILGMDSFLSLPTWRDWEVLFELTHFAVGERPGYVLSEQTMLPGLARAYAQRSGDAAALTELPAGAVVTFRTTLLDISASGLRRRLAAGRSARYLLPATVLDYIAANSLYQ